MAAARPPPLLNTLLIPRRCKLHIPRQSPAKRTHPPARPLSGCCPAAAVQRGRELRADYKLVARAMTRKGNALVKQGKLEEAVQVYQKSLTEHRWGLVREQTKPQIALHAGQAYQNSLIEHWWGPAGAAPTVAPACWAACWEPR